MEVLHWYPQLDTPFAFDGTTRSFKTKVLAEVDDPRIPLEVIYAWPQCPSRFTKHPVHTQYWCLDTQATQLPDVPNVFQIDSQWSDTIPNALLQNGEPVFQTNPVQRPLRVSMDHYMMPRTMRLAYFLQVGSGTNAQIKEALQNIKQLPPPPEIPVTTTAGEPLFLQIECEVPVWHCTKNVSGFPPFMSNNRMFVNSDTVKFQGVTYQPFMLLFRSFRASEARFASGQVYYEASWSLMVAPDQDGWCEKRRNAGYHEKKTITEFKDNGPGTTPTIRIYDILDAIKVGPLESPQFPSSPVLLTKAGHAYRMPNYAAGEKDSTPVDQRTGPIMTTESVGTTATGPGLTNAEFEAAELLYYCRMPIPFNKYIPLL